MCKRIFLSVIIGGLLLLGTMGVCLAGIDPSPFQPEINKLHSIELQVAAINKRLAKVNEIATLPPGTTNYLNAMADQMLGVKTKLEDVLSVLPRPSVNGSYIGEDEAIFALGSIGADTKDTYTILENIVSRMGVDPCPFLPVFNDVSRTIITKINFHFEFLQIHFDPPPILPPLTLP